MAIFIKALFALEMFEQEITLQLMLDNSENESDGETYARGINHYELDGDTYYGHGGFYGTLLAYNLEMGGVLSAHLAQAVAPYDVEDLVNTILEVIEAR